MNESTSVHEQQNVLIAAANELFDSADATVTLPSGVEVTVKNAKVKHLKQITQYIQEFVSSFDPQEILTILAAVSRRQEARINAGDSPYTMDTDSMVKEVVGEASLLMRVMNAGVDTFTLLAPLFTSLSREEFEDLDIDEGALVIFGVFGRNYHFFTRQVLPVIRACLAQRMQAAPKKTATTSAPAQ